jgi:hypothetical protein
VWAGGCGESFGTVVTETFGKIALTILSTVLKRKSVL